MIFNEIYGCYYNAVAKILENAIKEPISKEKMREIVEKHAFSESFFEISSKINSQEYQLLSKNGTTPIKNKISMPLTTIQKRWLKAIFLDKRIRLFTDDDILPDVEELFNPNDYYIYDKYNDGDNYDDENYIKIFRTILSATKNKQHIKITMTSNKGRSICTVAFPEYIEYSPKDDKFRLYTSGSRQIHIVNISTIKKCEIYNGPIYQKKPQKNTYTRYVEIELYDIRNTLERFMLHFAHYKKVATKEEDNKYRIIIYYESIDESELIIRILSFGQFVKVVSPEGFLNQIRYRINKQKLLFNKKWDRKFSVSFLLFLCWI